MNTVKNVFLTPTQVLLVPQLSLLLLRIHCYQYLRNPSRVMQCIYTEEDYIG